MAVISEERCVETGSMIAVKLIAAAERMPIRRGLNVVVLLGWRDEAFSAVMGLRVASTLFHQLWT